MRTTAFTLIQAGQAPQQGKDELRCVCVRASGRPLGHLCGSHPLLSSAGRERRSALADGLQCERGTRRQPPRQPQRAAGQTYLQERFCSSELNGEQQGERFEC